MFALTELEGGQPFRDQTFRGLCGGRAGMLLGQSCGREQSAIIVQALTYLFEMNRRQ